MKLFAWIRPTGSRRAVDKVGDLNRKVRSLQAEVDRVKADRDVLAEHNLSWEHDFAQAVLDRVRAEQQAREANIRVHELEGVIEELRKECAACPGKDEELTSSNTISTQPIPIIGAHTRIPDWASKRGFRYSRDLGFQPLPEPVYPAPPEVKHLSEAVDRAARKKSPRRNP